MIKYQLSTLMGTSILFFGCTKQDLANKLSHEKVVSKSSSISSADYFRGIFFLDGPLVNVLGPYKKLSLINIVHNQHSIESLRKTENNIIGYIETNDKGYLNHFKQMVTSGDYHSVKLAITRGQNILFKAIYKKYGVIINSQNINQVLSKKISASARKINSSSYSEIAQNLSRYISSDSASTEPPANYLNQNVDVDEDEYFWVYLYGALAIGAVLTLIIGPDGKGTDVPQMLNSKNSSFAYEDYLSTITLNCENRNY